MRTMCPKCGVTSLDGAEFCMSCGQSLKSKVSSIPPSRVSRTPASEVNVDNVVIEKTRETLPSGVQAQKSVRYRTISSNARQSSPPNPQAEAGESNDVADGATILIAEGVSARSSNPPVSQSASQKRSPQSDVSVSTQTVAEKEEIQAISPVGFSYPLSTQADFLQSKKFRFQTDELPSLGIQHIWYKITGFTGWNTIAIIPASADSSSALEVAHGLGAMAVREPCEFVRVVNSSLTAYAHFHEKSPDAPSDDTTQYPYEYLDMVKQLQPNVTSAAVTQLTRELLNQFDKAIAEGALSQGKVFVTLDPLFSHPDAIALGRAVDKLIICVKLGQTKFESVRKIIETLGKDKILGCILVN